MQNYSQRGLLTQKIAYAAILISLNIVLTRFLSIQTQFLRISFSFLPMAILSILVNPLLCGLSSAISDILGFLIFPTGPYFPGFTLSAFLYGLIYGLFFYKKKITLLKIIISNIIVVVLVDLCLNTIWLVILYNMNLEVILVARVIKSAITLPVQIVIIYLTKILFIDKFLNRIIIKEQYEDYSNKN